jgi:hypothetical protein
LATNSQFVVIAADQIFAALDLVPNHRTAVRIRLRLCFSEGCVALLGVYKLAPLIVVKLLKFHGFNV